MRWARFTRVARRGTTLLMAVGLSTSGVAMIAPATPSGAAPAAPDAPTAPALPPEGAVPDIEGQGWAKVLNEEFTGATLDESIWTVSEGPGTAGPGMNTKDAVRIEPDPGQAGDGTATITTYTIDTNGAAAGGLQHFTGEIQSGAIGRSWSGYQSAYGYIESRVKLHMSPKTYSAFWLLSPNWHRAPWGDPAASGPEIDIFEIGDPVSGDLLDGSGNPVAGGDGNCDWQVVHEPCDEIAGGNLHWNGFDEDHVNYGNQMHWTGPSPQDNFITYGLLWTPDGYRLYRNGIQTFQSSEAITYNPELIILDQFQGGDIAGDVPAAGYGTLATSTTKMVIDYVKVWQRPISDIPNRTVAANTPVAVPFSITDFTSASSSASVGVAGKPRPEGVRIDSSSSNTTLVPNDRVVVTGNEPADSDGTLTNAGFESGTGSWGPTGAAPPTTWTTRKRSGTSSLRVTQAGGRAQQTITGLRPNTAYVAGGFSNLELSYTDTHPMAPTGAVTPGADGRFTWVADSNGNGAVDSGETEALTQAGDALAEFDIGIVDTDESRGGLQEVRATRGRNGWEEAARYYAPHKDAWTEQSVSFTTGPNTDEVTFFVDNTVTPGDSAHTDADLSFDDVFVRPVVPPNRTVAVRPATDATGTTIITLTAWVDQDGNGSRAAAETLGTEAFTLNVTRGSTFTNGDFESLPLGTGWELWDNAPGVGADVVVHDPFQLDRVLELAGPGWQPDTTRRNNGTVFQKVSGLQPNTAYTMTVTGKGTDMRFNFEGALIDGTHPDPCIPLSNCQITSAGWISKIVNFTTNATGSGRIVLIDWTFGDGLSLVDDITLTTATPTSNPPLTSPLLTALGEQRITSSAPAAVNFSLPNNSGTTTVTSVTSDNKALIPDANLGVTAGTQHKLLSITLTPDRTGKATLTVKWNLSGAPQPDKTIPVIVSDNRMVNPGFESTAAWTNATIVTAGQRTGAGALQVSGATQVKQVLSGMPDNTTFVLDGWVNGGVDVKLKTLPDSSRWPSSSFTPEFNATFNGSGWTSNRLRFTTVACQDCHARGGTQWDAATSTVYTVPGEQIEITLSDADGTGSSLVDDLQLVRVPNASPLRELSLSQSQTAFAWDTRSTVDVGRIPAGALSTNGQANPAVVGLTTTDVVAPPGGMGEVLPDVNTRLIRQNPQREYEWTLEARATTPATQRTGRSNVTMTLTDPVTALTNQRSATVTMNAGSLDNGDFQRSGGRLGWAKWSFAPAGWEVVEKQRWDYMSSACSLPPPTWPSPTCPAGVTVGRSDADKVMRISSGIVGLKVTGLTAGVNYVLQANAIGDGSTLKVLADDGGSIPAWGTLRGQVTINSHTWAPTPNLTFTAPAGDPEVWIFVVDAQPEGIPDGPDPGTEPDVVPASDRACALFAAGETCIDDIGLFEAADLSL